MLCLLTLAVLLRASKRSALTSNMARLSTKGAGEGEFPRAKCGVQSDAGAPILKEAPILIECWPVKRQVVRLRHRSIFSQFWSLNPAQWHRQHVCLAVRAVHVWR